MATNIDAAQRKGGQRVSPFSSLLVSFQEFLREPSLVGSAFPASESLADALLDTVDWSRAKVVVEYGPGSGPLTRAMLDRMPQDGHLVAIDVSDRFTRHLRQTISDPRLIAVEGSAEAVGTILERHGLHAADLIVTGIPFSTMSPQAGAKVLDASADILKGEGQLLAYQMRSTIAPMLERRFGQVDRSYAWRNIPPCHLYRAHGPLK